MSISNLLRFFTDRAVRFLSSFESYRGYFNLAPRVGIELLNRPPDSAAGKVLP